MKKNFQIKDLARERKKEKDDKFSLSEFYW